MYMESNLRLFSCYTSAIIGPTLKGCFMNFYSQGVERSSSMFCHYCGNKIPDDAPFCNSCGRKTPQPTGQFPVDSNNASSMQSGMSSPSQPGWQPTVSANPPSQPGLPPYQPPKPPQPSSP